MTDFYEFEQEADLSPELQAMQDEFDRAIIEAGPKPQEDPYGVKIGFLGYQETFVDDVQDNARYQGVLWILGKAIETARIEDTDVVVAIGLGSTALAKIDELPVSSWKHRRIIAERLETSWHQNLRTDLPVARRVAEAYGYVGSERRTRRMLEKVFDRELKIYKAAEKTEKAA